MEDWRISQTCRKRRALQNFYMISVVFQKFAMIQCLSLLPISLNSLPKFVLNIIVFIYALCDEFYVRQKLLEHLESMNHEIQKHYRNRVAKDLRDYIIDVNKEQFEQETPANDENLGVKERKQEEVEDDE